MIALVFPFGLLSPFLEVAVVGEAFVDVLACGNRIAAPSTCFHLCPRSSFSTPLTLPQKTLPSSCGHNTSVGYPKRWQYWNLAIQNVGAHSLDCSYPANSIHSSNSSFSTCSLLSTNLTPHPPQHSNGELYSNSETGVIPPHNPHLTWIPSQ